MIPAEVRNHWPFKAKILSGGNPYGLPAGKEFLCARRREGDGSPFPIEIFSYAGDYRVYQMKEEEVILTAL